MMMRSKRAKRPRQRVTKKPAAKKYDVKAESEDEDDDVDDDGEEQAMEEEEEEDDHQKKKRRVTKKPAARGYCTHHIRGSNAQCFLFGEKLQNVFKRRDL